MPYSVDRSQIHHTLVSNEVRSIRLRYPVPGLSPHLSKYLYLLLPSFPPVLSFLGFRSPLTGNISTRSSVIGICGYNVDLQVRTYSCLARGQISKLLKQLGTLVRVRIFKYLRIPPPIV